MSPKTDILAARLSKEAWTAVRKGHPWVFEKSILRQTKPGNSGDVVILYDHTGSRFAGVGLLDPDSAVRVKVLTGRKQDPPVGPELFKLKLENAVALRDPFPGPGTDGYRLIHGESDSFPGLAADLYADTLVLKSYSAAWLPYLETIRLVISERFSVIRRTVFRFSREIREKLPEGFSEGMILPPDPNWDGTTLFHENGLLFRADPVKGQKTGFFLDQRDNRARVERLSAGKRILNVFSFSGGFSIAAARGGACEVVSIDADKHALQRLNEHFELNSNFRGVRECRHTELAGDAFDLMRKLAEKHERFDLVIVDPPSFAKSAAEAPGALRTYSRLARLAAALTEKNGMLVFASCSSRVGADELFSAVHAAAGRSLREIERTAHAVDHPAKFRESSYLKCLYAVVE